MKAALFVGGWEGHTPTHFSDWYKALLEDNGFSVDVYDTLDPQDRRGVPAILPIWTSSLRSGHRPARATRRNSAT